MSNRTPIFPHSLPATRRLLALLALLAACPAQPPGSGDSATDTTSAASTASTTAPPVTTTSPTTTTGDPATTAHDTGVDTGVSSTSTSGPDTFFDVGDSTKECDNWIEDCPEGQKCMPVSLYGDDTLESLVCVDIVPNPAKVGEPCTAGPISTGEDTCEKHSICLNIDPDTGIGACSPFCTGTPDMPGCDDPFSSCWIKDEGVLILCIPPCDPIAQDCAPDQLCIPHPENPKSFICVPDGSNGEQAYDPCEYANVCEKGFACLGPELSDMCDPMAPGCCIAFCDTSLMGACTTPGEVCLPWYEMGQAPPGFENVGVCGLPQ